MICKNWMLALGLAVAMLGMSSVAEARDNWWYCYLVGDVDVELGSGDTVYITDVFYDSENVYLSDFMKDIPDNDFNSGTYIPGQGVVTVGGSGCTNYETRKQAKKARRETKHGFRKTHAIRHSGFDG